MQIKTSIYHLKNSIQIHINIAFNKEEKRNAVIYTWELKNTDEYDYEANTPTYKKILPHIVPIITSFKVKKH